MIFKKPTYKTGEVAALLGVTIPTIIRYCNSGLLPSHKTEFGHRRLQAEDVYRYLASQNMVYDDTESIKSDVIYARVSTHRQAERGDLERQVEKVKLFAIEQNVNNLIVKTDIASGLNDNRKNLLSLIDMVQKGEVNRIFVLYKDRLTRFGYHYLKKICDFHGVSIVVVSDEMDNKSQSEELAEDIISLIHSFSGKLYGLRHKIRKEIKCDDES
jgi:DNA binding domain, excisionase family